MVLLLLGSAMSVLSIALMDNPDTVISLLGGLMLFTGLFIINMGRKRLGFQQNK